MDNKTKGYIALGIAAYFGVGPVVGYMAVQQAKNEGRLPENPRAEEVFNQGFAASLIIPGLALWYGVSKLRAA